MDAKAPFAVQPPEVVLADIADVAELAFEADVTDNTAFAAASALADVLGPAGFQNSATMAVFPRTKGRNLGFNFVGTGSDNQTGAWRLWGARAMVRRRRTTPHALQWLPTLLYEGTFTLGTRTGVAGTSMGDPLLSASYRYADTVAITDQRTITDLAKILGPGSGGVGATTPDGTPQTLLVDAMGYPLYLLQLRRDTATAVNALVFRQ